MAKRIVGICIGEANESRIDEDYRLMREAGFEWIRQYSALPFGESENDVNPKHLECIGVYKRAAAAGLKQIAVSPIPEVWMFDEKAGEQKTRRCLPDWVGRPDCDEYYDIVYRAMKRLAEDTKDYIGMWQVSNEMDIKEFRGDMTLEQAGRYLVASAKGLRAGNPSAVLGINPASYDEANAKYLYDLCYVDNPDLLDYVGVDAYFGTWGPGKVNDWTEAIDFLHGLTDKPVFINEWGYASEGGEAFRGKTGRPCFEDGHFPYVWHKEHSEAEQAEYAAAGVRLLLTYPNCMGFLYYSWRERDICIWCGKKDCPAGCSWGIVDFESNPKPAYYALKENILKYR